MSTDDRPEMLGAPDPAEWPTLPATRAVLGTEQNLIEELADFFEKLLNGEAWQESGTEVANQVLRIVGHHGGRDAAREKAYSRINRIASEMMQERNVAWGRQVAAVKLAEEMLGYVDPSDAAGFAERLEAQRGLTPHGFRVQWGVRAEVSGRTEDCSESSAAVLASPGVTPVSRVVGPWMEATPKAVTE